MLAQPEPLPEQILTKAAEAIIDNALKEWGSPASTFSPEVRAAYIEAIRDPQHAHAICEEYPAAATIDREHDRADLDAKRKIQGPVLVLWSARGALQQWYGSQGGPLGIWREWADDLRGIAIEGGHFFPEELPHQTAGALLDFFSGRSTSASASR